MKIHGKCDVHTTGDVRFRDASGGAATDGYHTLVFQNQTEMEPAVAATAWGQSLTCDTFNEQIFDAIRAFRRDRVDKGPEFIP